MFEKIRERIAEQLSIEEDEIKMESSFIDDLGADSLDIVEINNGIRGRIRYRNT